MTDSMLWLLLTMGILLVGCGLEWLHDRRKRKARAYLAKWQAREMVNAYRNERASKARANEREWMRGGK